MYHLHAALTDLAIADPEGAAATLPRLPILEGLLARADRREAPTDWRRWALSTAGLAAKDGDLPLGRTLAAATGLAVDGPGNWFMATPVRLVAGMREVHFDPQGALVLGPGERGALLTRFASDFGGESLQLVDAAGQLLLRREGSLEVRTHDPAALAGRSLADGAPQGADAGSLQRLMTELQMWLHARPLTARDGRIVNGLWLWGGGCELLRGTARWPVLACDDPFLHAAAAGATPDRTRLLDALCVADLVREGGTLVEVDTRWFEPLAARLRDGELRAAHVHCAGHVYALRHGQRWRRWRRIRPWWECLT